MDDVAVYSNDFDDHLHHLEATLRLAVDGEMKIHPRKVHFCCTNVEFIGHRVSRGGIFFMAKKVEKFWHGNGLPQSVMLGPSLES